MTALPIVGTFQSEAGDQVTVDITVTRPEPPPPPPGNTTLLAVKSKVIAYDASDLRQAYAVPGTKASVTGIDRKIQEMLGLTKPVNGGYRDYLSMSAYLKDEVGSATLTALNTDLELVNLFTHEGDRLAHYGDPSMRDVLAGNRDELARAVVRKRRGHRYLTLFHEPELHGATPILYRMALHRMMRVMIEEAQEIGLTPNEFCVGGCLTDSGMVSSSQDWWWWDGLDPDLLASNMVGGYWNPYWTAGMTNPPSERIKRQAQLLIDGGVNRLIVAESAKVGSITEQIAWLRDFDATITSFNGKLEIFATFHSPDGPASGPAQFKGDAVIELGKIMVRRNR